MLIEISSLSKSYVMGETVVPALRGANLKIDAGEFVAVMGPSGSGKSTLMHLLGLLDVPDGGSYKLAGEEVARLSEDELAARRRDTIGFVFQQFNLLSRTTALENVALPLIYGAPADREELPRRLLEDVGLAGRLRHKPNELSGGQQQRVAIARALVRRPRIILADEPTGNLDSKSQEEIMELLEKLNGSGITIVLVTHEEEIASYARRVIRMRDGLIVSDVTQGERGDGPVRVRARPAAPAAARSESRAAGLSFREMSEHFRQAHRSLSANKVRTGLSVLGILIGVAAVIAMLALGAGAKAALEQSLASLGSNLLVLRAGSMRSHGVSQSAQDATRFTRQDADDIRREVPSIRRIAPSVSGNGQIASGNKNWSSRILGTTPDYPRMRASVPDFGRFFTDEEDRSRARVAVLGRTVVRELFPDSNPLGEMVRINRVNFKVVGVLPEKGATSWRDQDDIVIVPLNTAMRRVLGKDYVDSIDIEVESPEAMEAAQEGVKDLIIRSHRLPPSRQETFEIRNMAEIQDALSETSRTMSMLLGAIAFISLLVGGIGIMNIMLVSVTERTREIGLRKAVGAGRRDILSQFLIEALVVSIGGGALGIVLGSGISFLLSTLAGWSTRVSPGSVALAVTFSAVIGVGFGLWPARKAAALNPIEALRYE